MSSRLLLRFLGNLWAALSQNPSLRLEPGTCTDRNTHKKHLHLPTFRTVCLRVCSHTVKTFIISYENKVEGCRGTAPVAVVDHFFTSLSLLLLCAHVLHSINSVSHTLTRLWHPAIVWIWNVKEYFLLSNAYRCFSQSLLIEAPPLTHTYTHTHTHTRVDMAERRAAEEESAVARWWTRHYLCDIIDSDGWWVCVLLRSSHELVTKWQKCHLWLTVTVSWRVSETSSLLFYIHKKNHWHKKIQY